jgi:hypothetical protein
VYSSKQCGNGHNETEATTAEREREVGLRADSLTETRRYTILASLCSWPGGNSRSDAQMIARSEAEEEAAGWLAVQRQGREDASRKKDSFTPEARERGRVDV